MSEGKCLQISYQYDPDHSNDMLHCLMAGIVVILHQRGVMVDMPPHQEDGEPIAYITADDGTAYRVRILSERVIETEIMNDEGE